MEVGTYLTFCAVAAALAFVPGPTVTVIIANSLRYGTHAGLLNVLGTQLGVAIWLVIAGLGLQAAIEMMGVWFDVLRVAGAAYLIGLGVKLWRGHGKLSNSTLEERPQRDFLLQGLTVIMTNPKMLVLFGALIPPFLTPGANLTRETILLGGTFMLIAVVGDTLYAVLAGRAGSFLSRSRVRGIEVVSGTCLVIGGLWMALKGR